MGEDIVLKILNEAKPLDKPLKFLTAYERNKLRFGEEAYREYTTKSLKKWRAKGDNMNKVRAIAKKHSNNVPSTRKRAYYISSQVKGREKALAYIEDKIRYWTEVKVYFEKIKSGVKE